VNIPRAAQTEFRIGNVTGLKYDATGEYYRTNLMNFTLGGGFNGRVNINLREDKGWTYGARSNFSGDKYSGGFTFSSGIRADATDSALYEVINEIRNYAIHGVTPEEIAFMQSSIGQSDARNYETAAQKSSFISRMLVYDLPADYVKKQQAILKGIKKDELDLLSKKYFNVDKINIVLVGDKKKIAPGLERLGYEIIELDADGNLK
jgi:zinc protease